MAPEVFTPGSGNMLEQVLWPHLMAWGNFSSQAKDWTQANTVKAWSPNH